MNKDRVSYVFVEQWRTCVDSYQKLLDRKAKYNLVFLIIFMAMALGLLYCFVFRNNSSSDGKEKWVLCGASIFVLIYSIAWKIIMCNLKLLAEQKLKIIFKLERELPLSPFKNEFLLIQHEKEESVGSIQFGTWIFSFFAFILACLAIAYSFLKAFGKL